MHPRWLRCSALRYSRYSRLSRLAIGARDAGVEHVAPRAVEHEALSLVGDPVALVADGLRDGVLGIADVAATAAVGEAALALASRHGVELPIAAQVAELLAGRKDALSDEAVRGLHLFRTDARSSAGATPGRPARSRANPARSASRARRVRARHGRPRRDRDPRRRHRVGARREAVRQRDRRAGDRAVTPFESVKPIRRGEGALLSRIEYARLIDVFGAAAANIPKSEFCPLSFSSLLRCAESAVESSCSKSARRDAPTCSPRDRA